MKTIQLVVTVFVNGDGSMNVEATDAEYATLRDKMAATMSQDFDTVSAEVNAFLLDNPGMRTIPTTALIRSLWERRVENGELKGKSQSEKTELYARLEEILPNYVRSATDQFHVGRKTGIAIRYVPGEELKDAKGKTVYDGDANPVQRFRHSEEEWLKLTTPKVKDTAPESSKSAAAQ